MAVHRPFDLADPSHRILTEPRMARRVMLGMVMQMWSQLSGINTM